VRLEIAKAVPVNLLHTVETPLDEPGSTAPGTLPQKPQEDVSQGNPHIWLDPTVQEAAADKIRAALAQIDPANAAYYQARADEYIGQIKALDQEFRTATAAFPRKEFIGFHSAYDYLAHRYGLNQIAALEEYPEQGITPAQADRVIKLIKEKQIKVIFTETALPSKDADLIVRQTGVRLAVLQPLETYDDPKDTYVSLMRQNLANLKQALGQ
jgi:zinc transport system substrate-binding protein